MMNLLRTQWLVALAAIVMLSGCGVESLDVEYVEGVVTLDGTPAEGVTVSFSPVAGSGGTPAVGTTDAKGVFKLTATKKGGAVGAGTTVGDYNVSFSKVAVAGGGASQEDEHQQAMEKIEKGESGLSGQVATSSEIPSGYANPTTSGFTASVKAGENKGADFTFALKKDFTPAK